MAEYEIQELVDKSGIPRRTIYFYTQQGIIPPPQGAGLAARYGEEHLLRLRLVPLFRRDGLRLDEIRIKLNQMSMTEMLQTLEKEKSPNFSTGRQAVRPYEQEGQCLLQFLLPKGIQLLVPSSLKEEDRDKVTDLLNQIRTIWDNDGRVQ
jgi:DNA-binding transcriptional MerR regulator